MPANLLLTGFEPFDGSNINPSEKIVHALANQVIEGVTVIGCILPVDQVKGPQALLAALDQHAPDAVLCLGEASRRAAVSVERLAINLLDFRIPDNAGRQVVDRPIMKGGPAAYFVTIPDRQVMQAIQTAGVPVELSLSAGAYLCNQVLYTLLHYLSISGSRAKAGFLHLPSLPRQACESASVFPTMSLETACAGVRAAIAEIGRAL